MFQTAAPIRMTLDRGTFCIYTLHFLAYIVDLIMVLMTLNSPTPSPKSHKYLRYSMWS